MTSVPVVSFISDPRSGLAQAFERLWHGYLHAAPLHEQGHAREHGGRSGASE
jgi:hypothetical protein